MYINAEEKFVNISLTYRKVQYRETVSLNIGTLRMYCSCHQEGINIHFIIIIIYVKMCIYNQCICEYYVNISFCEVPTYG
mmetsp:Transcript_51090/g.100922  ORF Transcript_51090/g.100922 Transcript_51090/m.100922 type:complete len:80 (-) Transcript_51090:21-260(-)